MPCFSALNRDLSLPLCEVGPELRFEFCLLASARFEEVLGVSVMGGGPIVGMWIGEVMSSQGGEGVLSLAPSQGFAILGLYYSYRKLFGLSWNFFGIISEFLAGRLAISGEPAMGLRPKPQVELELCREKCETDCGGQGGRKRGMTNRGRAIMSHHGDGSAGRVWTLVPSRSS
jgi:hypothetical protein